MGYSTTSYSVLSSDMRQTPETVNMVLDFAGWNANEAADASGVDALHIHMAATGQAAMTQAEWVRLLDVCGRRVFDEGCDE